ncbi:MAG TPA: hypothetical protein VJ914_41045 [Pseudonocardiaceae bacterium]|nr:hypothetical protein [Pseudonocardiaceae bacterium]
MRSHTRTGVPFAVTAGQPGSPVAANAAHQQILQRPTRHPTQRRAPPPEPAIVRTRAAGAYMSAQPSV